MLGKIIKHEFKATYGVYILMFVALFAVTCAEKVTQYIDMDFALWDVFKILLTIVFVLFVIFMAFASQIVSVVRFYKSMTKDQAYLTHTIPVKESTIIWGKAITAFVWIILSFIASGIAAIIFLFDSKMLDYVSEGFDMIADAINKEPVVILWAVLVFVLVIISVFAGLFQFYAAIGMGQMFASHKVAGAVLFYFIIYYAFNFVTMTCIFIVPEFVRIGDWMSEDALVTVVLAGYVVIELIYLAVCYGITNYRFSRRMDIQ